MAYQGRKKACQRGKGSENISTSSPHLHLLAGARSVINQGALSAGRGSKILPGLCLLHSEGSCYYYCCCCSSISLCSSSLVAQAPWGLAPGSHFAFLPTSLICNWVQGCCSMNWVLWQSGGRGKGQVHHPIHPTHSLLLIHCWVQSCTCLFLWPGNAWLPMP